MPFTIGGYNEARATAVTTLTEVDAVDDDHLRTKDEDLYIPELNYLIGVIAMHGNGTLVAGGDLTGVRLQSPSLRATWPLDISPQGLPGEHSHIALRMVAADGVRDVAAADDMQ